MNRNLGPQFADPDRSKNLKVHDKYVIHPASTTLMHAYPISKNESGEILHPTASNKRPVASLSWFGGRPTEEDLQGRSNTSPGTIYKAIVKPAHQRRGLATAMLEHARQLHPESQIRHSGALSPEGRAWAEKAR
jgi:GNAT superfamily N-acetyltransferase